MNECREIELAGIDGGSPLGFLAAVGAASLTGGFAPDSKLYWRASHGAWRPVITEVGSDPQAFLERIENALRDATTEHFEIDKRLPFEAEKFAAALQKAQSDAQPKQRRTSDFLAAFGSEALTEKGVFKDTSFRMVRSGDSKLQGLPHYALETRKATGIAELRRTLFEPWDYRDDGPILRLDPIEDQRYALRWKNPSKSSTLDGPGIMLGANALALEALQLFPCAPNGGRLITTGFHRDSRRQTFFIWPIWVHPVSFDVLRSLVALAELQDDPPPRERLARRGIVEIYRSQRIAQSMYYSNFAPAEPA